MTTNEIIGVGIVILCVVVAVIQLLGILLAVFGKMITFLEGVTTIIKEMVKNVTKPNVEKLKTRKD